MQTVVYFTAGIVPTSDELADIAKLNTAAEAPYLVLVTNGAANAKYGETNRLIPCELVAGTIPTIYAGKPTIDPDSIGTGATVANGDTVAVRNSAGADSHNATAVVTDDALTGVNLAATVAMVDNSDVVAVQNSAGAAIANGTANVANGVVTNVRLPATVAGVATLANVPVLPATGTTPAQGNATAAISAGVLTGVRLAATAAVVTNGQTIAVTGGTVTINVAANAVTATYTAS